MCLKKYSKKAVLFLFGVTVFFNLLAQPTDSWVINNQQYFKIKSAANGLMRVSVESLVQAGVPVSTFAPQNIQVFFRGKEIPVYIRGEATGTIEYLEFIGEKNDGWLDSGMYVTPADQTNPYYSLITDTSSYFLTWNQSFNNYRYQAVSYTGNAQTPLIETGIKTTVYTGNMAFKPADAQDPELSAHEGWVTSPDVTLGNTTTRNLQLESLAQVGEIICSTAVIGANKPESGNYDNHHLQILHGSNILAENYMKDYAVFHTTFTINAGTISAPNLTIGFRSINDMGVSTDMMSVSFLKAEYPATFLITGSKEAVYKIAGANHERKIVLTGYGETEQPTVYEPNFGWRLIPVYNETGWSVTIPANDSEIILHINRLVNNITAGNIKRANMQLNISSSVNYLVISHSSLMSAAVQYAAFRNGEAADIEVLYNRFTYGIEHHPMAIRYFLQAHILKGNTKPEYLFLIGKGMEMVTLRSNPALIPQNLVPSTGFPPSDALLVSRLTANSFIPEMAVGRLSALNQQQVTNYLNKVREHELRTPSLEAKNVLHFGGGATAVEQAEFANYLNIYKNTISDSLFGGYVSSFFKNSSAPIITTQSDSVKKIVEEGPLLLTFFGHSWTGGFDQNIDDPENFNNQGKYPLIIANSCYSGNIFLSGNGTISEKWMFIANHGAIAFLASAHLGYPGYLHNYTREFYRNIALSSYGESYGKSILRTVTWMLGYEPSIYTKLTALEFILHGDPAVSPVTWDYPDPMIDNNSLKIEPANITTAIDSFAVQIIVPNIGRALTKPLQIYVERRMPNGSTQTKYVILSNLYYKDTVDVYFSIDRLNSVGENSILVLLDDINEIDEQSELNNRQTISFPIVSVDIFPVYPFPNAMTSSDTVRLKASTGDAFAPVTPYILQIDTKSDFSSPSMLSKTINADGGVVEWKPDLTIEPNTPYYWRTAQYSTADSKLSASQTTEWNTSVFTRTDGVEGWKQNTIEQFKTDNLRFMTYNGNTLQFSEAPRKLTCYNQGLATGNDINMVRYDLDGNGDYGVCQAASSIVLVIIDSLTLLPWTSDRDDYGHLDYPKCVSRQRPNNYFTFTANRSGLNNMSNFIDTALHYGDYVLAYSSTSGNFGTWSENQFQSFEQLGASLIRAVPDNFPYIFFSRKGFPELTQEVVGDSARHAITLETILLSNFHYGSIQTNWIGPAQQWATLKWQPNQQLIQSSDSVIVKLYVPDKNSADSLISILYMTDTIKDLTFLNYQNTSVIKMEYFTFDEVNKTPVPPALLQVEYTPYPEIAINPNETNIFYSKTLNEGDTLTFSATITNVSHIDSDAFEINYLHSSLENNAVELKTVKIDLLPAFSSTTDTVQFSTRGKAGINQIQMSVNYPTSTHADYFPEPFTFNNVGIRSFEVVPDDRQPLLSVTFDGRYIMNNEIVSARPEIELRLTDRNKYIMLDDTSTFEIYLTNPNADVANRVDINVEMAANRMTWHPAGSNENECSILWKPEFETDGIYQLRVRAKDISNNPAGKEDYIINFEIINRSMITSLLNYPNPFTTSTCFVFTITGSRLPDELRIQIFTVTGRVVKEINMYELGSLRIGQNMTEYAWDGTDQFGDRLANGVYFYRIIAKMDGNNIEHFNTSADKYFKKEFGKMYLMK